MTINNWDVFIQNCNSMIGLVAGVNSELDPTIPFLHINPSLPPNKKFIFAHIPNDFVENFRTFFNSTFSKSAPIERNLGRVACVRQWENYREGMLIVPLTFFTNSGYRTYLERFSNIRITNSKLVYIYVAVDATNPFYQYFDEGNFIHTKLFLDNNGRILTKIGKTGEAYQYMYVVDSKVPVSQYMETHLLTPYKSKVRTVSSVFSTPGADTATALFYNSVNVLGSFSQQEILFDVDFRSETDLRNIPKIEIMQASKVKETTDFAQQLLLNIASLEDDKSITLPTNLIIKKDRVSYAGQDLWSDVLMPEKFLFEAKRFFPTFGHNENINKYIFEPVLKSCTVEELDWDRYLDAFIKYNWIRCSKQSPVNLKIGDVQIHMEYDGTRYYINKKRVNKDEVPEVLLKALCAKTQKGYNDIVEIISKTSLEMHRFINEGLTIHLNIASISSEIQHLIGKLNVRDFDVSFKIAREKNINYIELKDKFVRIKDSRILMDLNKQTVQYSRLMEIFGEGTKALHEPINVKTDATEIIRVAREKYMAAFEKSRTLLNDALKELGGKIIEWKDRKGVLISGSSGNTYFIHASNIEDPLKGEPECHVYHHPSNRHICIVDKSGAGRQAGVDKIVARMYALRNDSVLAEHIHTLSEYVKKPKA